METVYKSKTDAWLVALLAVAIAVTIYATSKVFSAGSLAGWWAAAIAICFGVGLPLWILLSTHYILESRQLVVRSGPFKWHIPLAEISSITPTSNPLSSPALSLDRLRIDYGRGRSLMISPRNSEQFLRDIEILRRDAV